MVTSFKDPRSRTLWRSGRVILRGQDMTDLRLKVYLRADGRCEVIKPTGRRCNKFAPWDGFQHGELSHAAHGPHKTDTEEDVLWSCRACHKLRHPGPQFTKRSAV